MNKNKLSGLSNQEREIISKLYAKEKDTVTVTDIMDIHPCKKSIANLIINKLVKKGWLQQLKHGIHTLIPVSSNTTSPIIENSWAIGMDLFKPAFISGWSAAEYWGLTEQIFNTITIISAKKQRNNDQVIGNVNYKIRVIKKDKFFGIKTVWIDNKKIDIASPHRLIIDILDLPRFGGGGRHVVDIIKQYWHSELSNPKLLLKYALQYKKGSVIKRLGYITEKLKAPVPKNFLEICQRNNSKGLILLDPDASKTGKINNKWRIKVNIPI